MIHGFHYPETTPARNVIRAPFLALSKENRKGNEYARGAMVVGNGCSGVLFMMPTGCSVCVGDEACCALVDQSEAFEQVNSRLVLGLPFA